jgi:prevent-host-death family protein
MMTSNHKGAVAELEIATAAMKLGIPVFRPLSDHTRADLVMDLGDRLLRVQCKWARLSDARDLILVHLGASRLSPRGYVRTTYSQQEVDVFGAYCGELDRCFLLPAERFAGTWAAQLRLTTPRNNQAACINLADDFDFVGAIAQLGERRHGMAEVVGSSPTSSTSAPAALTIGSNPFRDRLGYWMDRAAAGDDIVVTRHGKPRIRLSSVVPRRPRD